jgi:hypothetical protein
MGATMLALVALSAWSMRRVERAAPSNGKPDQAREEG